MNATADINAILSERQGTHGPYKEHARITQALKNVMQGEKTAFDGLSVCQRETLDMIAHKIGRVLAGNPNVQDHWDDIAGYAKLVSKDIAEQQQDAVSKSWANAALDKQVNDAFVADMKAAGSVFTQPGVFVEDKSKRNPQRPTCGVLCPTPSRCADFGECLSASKTEAH